VTKRIWNAAAGAALALALAIVLAAPHHAMAQAGDASRVWDIPFGTPADKIPTDFKMPACGTHGGPPSTRLKGFHEFAKCRAEPGTGLHEVWFSYDDDQEYYLRAVHADPAIIMGYRANTILDHLVVYSLLFDSEGRLQGFRIATDPREPAVDRESADMVGDSFKVTPFGADGWKCTDLPPLEGEEPYGAEFLKRICEKTADGRYASIETHRYLKKGQQAGRGGAPLAGEFEVGSWVEAINADLVKPKPAQ
jgi:hypothetical protein